MSLKQKMGRNPFEKKIIASANLPASVASVPLAPIGDRISMIPPPGTRSLVERIVLDLPVTFFSLFNRS